MARALGPGPGGGRRLRRQPDGSRRGLAAFDRATGRKLWETFSPDTSNEKTNPKNGYASSTPATDGRLVYAYLGPQGVMAVDFAGTLAWHAPVGPIQGNHGTGGSPLLYKDRVIIYQDQMMATEGSFIAAFDAKDRHAPLVEAARGEDRLGHADCDSRRRPRRDHRLELPVGHGLQP
jgi:outer membrane protein assembly factor BamB